MFPLLLHNLTFFYRKGIINMVYLLYLSRDKIGFPAKEICYLISPFYAPYIYESTLFHFVTKKYKKIYFFRFSITFSVILCMFRVQKKNSIATALNFHFSTILKSLYLSIFVYIVLLIMYIVLTL